VPGGDRGYASTGLSHGANDSFRGTIPGHGTAAAGVHPPPGRRSVQLRRDDRAGREGGLGMPRGVRERGRRGRTARRPRARRAGAGEGTRRRTRAVVPHPGRGATGLLAPPRWRARDGDGRARAGGARAGGVRARCGGRAGGGWRLRPPGPPGGAPLGGRGVAGGARAAAALAPVRGVPARPLPAPVRALYRDDGRPAEPPASAIGAAHPDHEVNIQTVAATKLAAIAAHRTQLPGGDPRALFPPGIVDALLDQEWFTDGGGDGAAAFFASLR